ncbi:hypothetical protein K461DRAFT_272394 [Myriangium duriaei CBS 260.36]|uniref:Uncharacterized protein n=1 Tax=Myriangium duriaei CBS 260.36 TaxID=1168546 RepID=A0A9P4ITX4_9PEZI|nr:hypothetical protein K461DRAFT_272394 [Myriangium duriaei CBS 260.36]
MFEGFKFDKHSDRPGSRGEGDDPKKVDPSKKEKEKEKSDVTVNELPLASPFSINETPRLEEPKRSLSLSISLSDVFRRGSQASSKSRSSSPVRKESNASSHKSRYLTSRNPDYDSDFPARNGSVASAASNTDHSPEGSRKPSYVPKNASNSFIKTASAAQTAEEKGRLMSQTSSSGSAQRQHSVFSAGSNGPTLAMSMSINNSVPRQPSIAMSTTSNGRNHSLALSDSSEVSSSTFSNGRRPSGVIANNIASRYMRTASLTSPDEDGNEVPTERRRRRSSNKSRQGSGGTVKPVQMAPDTYMQWQNSVSKAIALNGSVGYTKPSDNGRMQSLGGIADLTEEADEEPTTPKKSSRGKNPSFSMAVQPPSPARTPGSTRSKKFSIDTNKANGGDGDATRMDSGRTPSLADAISPTNVSFSMVDRTGKPKMTRTVSREAHDVSNSELESLGFHGAVPA